MFNEAFLKKLTLQIKSWIQSNGNGTYQKAPLSNLKMKVFEPVIYAYMPTGVWKVDCKSLFFNHYQKLYYKLNLWLRYTLLRVLENFFTDSHFLPFRSVIAKLNFQTFTNTCCDKILCVFSLNVFFVHSLSNI